MRAEAESLEERLRACAARLRANSEERAHQLQIFHRVEMVVEAGVFRKVAKFPPCVGVPGIPAFDADQASGRPRQAQDHLDRGGLPRAVRSQKAEDLATLEGER